MWRTQPAGDTLEDRCPDRVLPQEERALPKRMWTEMGQPCGPRQATNYSTSITPLNGCLKTGRLYKPQKARGRELGIHASPSLLPNGFSTLLLTV